MSMGVGGGGNWRQQARSAAEFGTGGPRQRPGSGDKHDVIVLLAVLGVISVIGLVVALW